MEINGLNSAMIAATTDVHKRLRPSLLEFACRVGLAYELRRRGFEVTKEKPVPVVYDDGK